MALKGRRDTTAQLVDHFMDEVAERGGPVTLSTAGSGASLDDSSAVCTYPAAVSGQLVLGVLMNDMVNIDQTRQHINFHQDEVQKGGKVTLLTKGWVVTDRIKDGDTISAQDVAYASPSGFFSNTGGTAELYGAKCGHFISTEDEDGYAKVYVDLPNKV